MLPLLQRLAFLAFASLFVVFELQAGIIFETTRIELGKVKAAGTIEQTFAYRVEGGPAEIVEIRPSCGCIKPQLTKRVLKAGETGTVPFAIHATGQDPGPHEYWVSLTVKDPAPRNIRLVVALDLYSDVVVSPSHVLVYMNGPKALQQTVTIRDSRPRRLDIEALESSSKRIETTFSNAKDDPAVQQVVLKISNDFPIGKTEEVIAVTTNDPEYPSFEIPILVIRSARVRCVPDALVLRTAEANKQVSRSLILSDREGKPISIASVDCDVPGVQCDWTKGAGKHSRIQVTIDAPKYIPASKAGRKSELVIHIAKPEQLDIVVPVNVE